MRPDPPTVASLDHVAERSQATGRGWRRARGDARVEQMPSARNLRIADGSKATMFAQRLAARRNRRARVRAAAAEAEDIQHQRGLG